MTPDTPPTLEELGYAYVKMALELYDERGQYRIDLTPERKQALCNERGRLSDAIRKAQREGDA